MDDITIPRILAQTSHPDRPPYASSSRPAGYNRAPQPSAIQLVAEKRASTASENGRSMQALGQPQNNGLTTERLTLLVTKSNQVYEVAKYQRDGDLLMFQDTQGRKGGVDVNEVDWRKTTAMTTEARSSEKPMIASQTN